MSQEFKYTAIILGKYDVGEVDRLYVLYTREAGKLRLLAKGAKKSVAKLAGNLETLNLIEAYVAKGRGQGKITGAIALQNFSSIRQSAEALEDAFDIFRLFNRMVSEEEKDEPIFDLLKEYLEVLDGLLEKESYGNRMKILKLGFIFKFLDSLGYQVQMGRCLACENILREGNNYFTVQRGGVLCGNCAKEEAVKVLISQNVIKLVRIFLANRLVNLGKVKIDQKDIQSLENLTKQFLKWIS